MFDRYLYPPSHSNKRRKPRQFPEGSFSAVPQDEYDISATLYLREQNLALRGLARQKTFEGSTATIDGKTGLLPASAWKKSAL